MDERAGWERREKYLGLRSRIKKFALAIIRLYTVLPGSAVAQVVGRQMLRSSTSVGAQFCEGHRAKSKADFISKMEGATQELEETLYWIELLADSRSVGNTDVRPIMAEADELLRILVSILRTTKART